MPRVIDPGPAGDPIELDEAVEALVEMAFDPLEPGAWDAAAPVLARLSANRSFLGRAAADALAQRPGALPPYGPQVLVLAAGRGAWFLRANLWPAESDPLLRTSGRGAFFYDMPHDHDFSFLTVGHYGPGYESDYWSYDPDDVVGLPGERVALRFEGRRRLEPGMVMLYRARRDIHDQKPPAAFSVTINIMAGAGRGPVRDQYRFDRASGTIAGTLNPSVIEAMLPLAAHLGGGDGRDLVEHFACRHPSDRIRFGAVRALAGAAPDEAARVAILEEAAGRGDAYVAPLAALALTKVEAVARWASEADA